MDDAERQRTSVLTGARSGIGHATPGTGRIVETLPLRRPGQPGEVADVIRSLCSGQSSYVTGAEIAVNAGQHV